MRDGQSEEGEGPTLETGEAEAGAPQTQTDPAEQRKQYYSQVENIVNQTCDPVAFNELGMNVLQALSVDVNDPEMKTVVEKAPQVAHNSLPWNCGFLPSGNAGYFRFFAALILRDFPSSLALSMKLGRFA